MFTGLSYEMPFPADLWLSVSESSVGRIGEHVASRKAKSGPESPFQLFISMWVVVYSPNTVDFRVGSQSFHPYAKIREWGDSCHPLCQFSVEVNVTNFSLNLMDLSLDPGSLLTVCRFTAPLYA